MARRLRAQLIDDFDGAEAQETVSFALDGQAYEIELSKNDAARLRTIFAPYIEAGRKAGGATKASPRHDAPQARSEREAKRQRNRAIRQWAQQNHIRLWHHGRIPNSVVARYEAEEGE